MSRTLPVRGAGGRRSRRQHAGRPPPGDATRPRTWMGRSDHFPLRPLCPGPAPAYGAPRPPDLGGEVGPRRNVPEVDRANAPRYESGDGHEHHQTCPQAAHRSPADGRRAADHGLRLPAVRDAGAARRPDLDHRGHRTRLVRHLRRRPGRAWPQHLLRAGRGGSGHRRRLGTVQPRGRGDARCPHERRCQRDPGGRHPGVRLGHVRADERRRPGRARSTSIRTDPATSPPCGCWPPLPRPPTRPTLPTT